MRPAAGARRSWWRAPLPSPARLLAAVEPGLALASTSYVQPRLDAFDDVRVLSQSRVAVQLLGPLSMDVTFDVSYDAVPPDDTESLDTALRTGVSVRF